MASQEFVSNTTAALEEIRTELGKLGQSDAKIDELKQYIDARLSSAVPGVPLLSETKPRKFDTKNLKLGAWNGDQKQFKSFEYHIKEFIRRELKNVK